VDLPLSAVRIRSLEVDGRVELGHGRACGPVIIAGLVGGTQVVTPLENRSTLVPLRLQDAVREYTIRLIRDVYVRLGSRRATETFLGYKYQGLNRWWTRVGVRSDRHLSCRYCGRAFVAPQRRGRPKAYCSNLCCRRAWRRRYGMMARSEGETR